MCHVSEKAAATHLLEVMAVFQEIWPDKEVITSSSDKSTDGSSTDNGDDDDDISSPAFLLPCIESYRYFSPRIAVPRATTLQDPYSLVSMKRDSKQNFAICVHNMLLDV